MAIPQSALEQMQKESPRSVGWAGQLLMFSGTVFFISLIIYVGLAYGYKSYLNSSVQKLQDQIQSFGQQIPVEEQTKIINFYSQLANLKMLLANHVAASSVFDWLEKNTQANVYFTRLNFIVASGQLVLSGNAKTMDDLSQQLAIFESKPEIESIKTGNFSLVNGLWQFDTSLSFEDKYFNNSTAASQ